MRHSPSPVQSRRQLARLLRDRREELLRRWTRLVLEDPQVPDASRLSEAELRDHVPELLDRLVHALEVPESDEAVALRELAANQPTRAHAHHRASERYAHAEALRELSHLRRAVLELCNRDRVPVAGDAAELLHAAIDESMATGAAETERALREHRQWLADLLKESREAVLLWELGGGIVSWSQGAEDLYGWSASEARGKNPHALLQTRQAARSMDQLDELLARERRWAGELEQSTRDGRNVLVASRLVVRTSEGKELVLETNRDITEQRRIEEARRESEARLRAIVETAVEGILTIDERGTVETLNPAAERLFGYRAGEVVGRNIKMLMPEPYRSEHDGYLKHYRETGERRIIGIGREVVGQHKNGTTFPIELAVSETWIGPRRIFTGILHDISERKRAEAEREHLLSSERAARTEAEHAAHLRDEFVATVSHELRSPLNAILGWTSMLRSGKLDPAAAAKALEVVERNAKAQATLVEDLLDISRIGSGKLRLDVRPVNLPAVLENVIATHAPAAQAKGVRVDKRGDDDSCTVQGDPARLEQIVSNLLSNAIKFTPQGGHVAVMCQRASSRIELIVSDTGKGIHPGFLPHVFDRFRQAEASLTRQHRGLGLGLSLVKLLVEQHGGNVRAESAGEGQGATFTVSLPIAAVRQVEPSPIDACVALAGVKVLVVDDEEDARTLIRRILEDCKAEVTLAASAVEALDQLPPVRPDVLISDIGMPELDGYQLIRAVRALAPEQGGATPAIALTAFARPEDRHRALEAGYQVHIAKPVDQVELLLVIANVTGKLPRPGAACGQ